MHIVIAGGSGQVGTILARAWHARNIDVVILSRAPATAPWRTAAWDARTLGPWTAELEGAAAVVNLAGRSVNCRYTAANRRDILNSRIDSTRVVGQAIARAARPPRLWLQSSTATIYAHRFDAPNDEHTGIIGRSEPDAPDTWRFSTEVARAWEQACTESPTPHTRKVLLRSAMIMSPDRDGIFDTLRSLVRRGLGGSAAGGRQYVSWVHDADFTRAIDWLIAHNSISGPVNIASPHPLPYAAFVRKLRHAAGVRFGLPATQWMLELGAFFMRTETELVLKSRRVIPARLVESGFDFEFPNWSDAARNLCARAANPQYAAAPASATA
jgi:uncharacterized protein (TIGR01777 family)